MHGGILNFTRNLKSMRPGKADAGKQNRFHSTACHDGLHTGHCPHRHRHQKNKRRHRAYDFAARAEPVPF